MKKSFLALAVLGAFAGAASAQSSVTLYGIIDLGLVKQNEADTGNPLSRAGTGLALGGVGMANEELNVNQATKSRIGFRGVEDLGGGLSAKFDLEHRFLGDIGATNPSGNNQFWDKAIVGLTSQTFGEITLGRDYGPTFYPQYLLDPWLNQGIAEVGGTSYAFAGYNLAGHQARYNNGIFYKAMVSGFTIMAAAELSEVDGRDNRYGLNLMYTAGPLMLAAAYDQSESLLNGDTDSLWMIGGSYDFGFIKPRLSIARSTINVPTFGEIKPMSVTLAATVPVGTNLIKMGYTQMELDNSIPGAFAETKQRKVSLGYEHVLSKRTALYTDITSGKTKTLDNVTGIDFGIRHMF